MLRGSRRVAGKVRKARRPQRRRRPAVAGRRIRSAGAGLRGAYSRISFT
jgi:hypothetical protein